jgi:hypothetical protein
MGVGYALSPRLILVYLVCSGCGMGRFQIKDLVGNISALLAGWLFVLSGMEKDKAGNVGILGYHKVILISHIYDHRMGYHAFSITVASIQVDRRVD